MNIVRNILAIIIGIIGGSIVNIGILLIGAFIVPPPEGMNVWDAESVKAAAALFQPKHFIMPIFAHQLGTLVGGFLAAKIAASHKMMFALIIGIWFLLGGIYAVTLIPTAPMWFIVLDLVLYIPMAWLGGKLGSGTKAASAPAPAAPTGEEFAETDGTGVGNG